MKVKNFPVIDKKHQTDYIVLILITVIACEREV